MYAGLYNPEDGTIRKVVCAPNEEACRLNMLVGEDIIFSASEIDNGRHAVDVAASPAALVDHAPDKTRGELLIAIKAERARREMAGASFNGVHITGDTEMARNLTNLKDIARDRLAAADNTVTPFRDGSNTMHLLAPADIVLIWQQSVSYVSALYAAKWALEAMDPIPHDFPDDSYWPSV